jgi:hypothetical protein
LNAAWIVMSQVILGRAIWRPTLDKTCCTLGVMGHCFLLVHQADHADLPHETWDLNPFNNHYQSARCCPPPFLLSETSPGMDDPSELIWADHPPLYINGYHISPHLTAQF